MTEQPDKAIDRWKISYNKWIPEYQSLREALFALGNGYFVTRGAFEESCDKGPHYPGTYLACGYNRLKTEISGRIIENEDLVNWPNWLCLNFRIENDKWFDLEDVDILSFYQELDMKKAVMLRKIRFRDKQDRITHLISRRFVHMGQEHLAALEWLIRPENWSGTIQVRSGIDGGVTNNGVERYRPLNGNHLEVLDTGKVYEDGILLVTQTRQSKIRMAQAARTQIFQDDNLLPVKRKLILDKKSVAQEFSFECREQRDTRVEKIVSIYTSRDNAISEEVLQSCQTMHRADKFQKLLYKHENAWSRLWHRCDIELSDKENNSQSILRFHIFHLLQTASFNSIDLDIGIPSRGWHGEAYRGHIFWDELFIFPFLNLRIPEITRELILYRYRRLGEARSNAINAGYKGAMFPWQSGSDGREESQVIHLNPKSGEWEPDNTYLQRHVNAAIAYNICKYYEVTLDIEFMSFYGVEMLLNISQFLASISTFNSERDRYEIHNVVGPDEFHTAYPDSDEPGLNNNAYTNVMTVWVLKNTLEKLNMLANDRKKELLEEVGIGKDELEKWEFISKKMFVPFHENDIISQFEGYEKLKEFDWEGYWNKYGNIERLDRILHAEGDSPNHYKAGKQADVLMLFYLFSAEELKELFERLGYELNFHDIIPKNINYYVKRSSCGSSLSQLVYSWVLARSDRESSWNYFIEALNVDFRDIENSTTKEGIHLGAMSGTVDMIQRCYTGFEIRDDVLWINPALSEKLNWFKMRIRYRGHWIWMEFDPSKFIVEFEKGWSPDVKIGFNDEVFVMGQGEKKTFDI
ncbi:MAG: glycoside hydrolase family 65 protein [bacterium]